jgi:hypothetical protein
MVSSAVEQQSVHTIQHIALRRCVAGSVPCAMAEVCRPANLEGRNVAVAPQLPAIDFHQHKTDLKILQNCDASPVP